MDAVFSFVNGASRFSPHNLLPHISAYAEPAWPIPTTQVAQILRLCILAWTVLYLSTLVLYLVCATVSYIVCFQLFTGMQSPMKGPPLNPRAEIVASVSSLSVLTAVFAPLEVGLHFGYGKSYEDVSEYGYAYLVVAPILLLMFTDMVTYFSHRTMHIPFLFKRFHKQHHVFVNTTPFSGVTNHPFDAFFVALPSQIFVYLLPIHNGMRVLALAIAACWGIWIHDRTTIKIPGLNCGSDHTLHHTKLKCNYALYFTFWDQLCGTYLSPLDEKVGVEYDASIMEEVMGPKEE